MPATLHHGCMLCFHVSDLHGSPRRYRALLDAVARERPGALFLGGDLLPTSLQAALEPGIDGEELLTDFLLPELRKLRASLGGEYPRVFAILGNDDPASAELDLQRAHDEGLLEYMHLGQAQLGKWAVFGYAHVPPTPFLFKHWERYDVSRYVPPGCVSPEEGHHPRGFDPRELRRSTIQSDLESLVGDADVRNAIFLFHSPPADSKLDRVAADGKTIDHVPLDLHVGSIAVRRFLELRKPRVSLHGHIHESTRLTGSWRDKIGATWCFNAAHDGPELGLVRFDPERPGEARRELL